jgi:hypothetical protein
VGRGRGEGGRGEGGEGKEGEGRGKEGEGGMGEGKGGGGGPGAHNYYRAGGPFWWGPKGRLGIEDGKYKEALPSQSSSTRAS